MTKQQFDEKEHPRNDCGEFIKKDINELKTELSQEIDNDGIKLAEHIKKFRNKENVPTYYVVSKVKDKEKERIEELTGEKVEAYNHIIDIDEIRHIENRHGEKGKADASMKDLDDYKNIPNIIHNFDSIDYLKDKNGNIVKSKRYKNSNSEPCAMIIYKKAINKFSCFVVEAVINSKNKELRIISAYKNKEK